MGDVVNLRAPRRPQLEQLRYVGIRRDPEHPNTLVLVFNRAPTDDEMRFFHDSSGQAAHYAWLCGLPEEGDGA